MKRIILSLSLMTYSILICTNGPVNDKNNSHFAPKELTKMEILNAQDKVASIQKDLNFQLSIAEIFVETAESFIQGDTLPPLTKKDKKKLIGFCDTSEASDISKARKFIENQILNDYQTYCSSPFSPSSCTQLKESIQRIDTVYEKICDKLNTINKTVNNLPIADPLPNNDLARSINAMNNLAAKNALIAGLLESVRTKKDAFITSLPRIINMMIQFGYPLYVQSPIAEYIQEELTKWNAVFERQCTSSNNSSPLCEDFKKREGIFWESTHRTLSAANEIVGDLLKLPTTAPDSPENLMRDMQTRAESYQHVIAKIRDENASLSPTLSSEQGMRMSGELLKVYHFVEAKSKDIERRFKTQIRTQCASSSDNPTCAALKEMESKFAETSDTLLRECNSTSNKVPSSISEE